MAKVEAMVLAKHGVKRDAGAMASPASAAQTNGVEEKASFAKKPTAPSKPAN